jgi:putative ATP-dependent endonuclease of the OLD family
LHHISVVEIKNFRSCQDVKAEISLFTPLVGYNNAGKSNILTAIQWLIKKETFKEKDFFDKTLPIEVIGTISNLTDNLLGKLDTKCATILKTYINNTKQLKIKRIQLKVEAGSKDFAFEVQDDQGNWQKTTTTFDHAISALFPDSIRIGAMENATEDSSKAKTSTTIGKLLSEFVKPIKEKHEDNLKNQLNEIAKLLSADGENRLQELIEIDDSINLKIKDFFPDMSLKIDINTPSFDAIFKDGTIRVYENGNEGRDCSAYGHGAQRSIQMALIRHLADIKTNNISPTSTTLLLIDEPELYLHPFAIEQVREALKALSKKGYQVLFSTHSPQMITSNDAQNTLLVHKDNHATKIRKRLKKAVEEKVNDAKHQAELLFSLTHSSKILFSEKIILTEGKTELNLLPFIFEEITKKTFGQEKIALIPQDGVHNTKKSMSILNAMDLPVKAIVDLDYILHLEQLEIDVTDESFLNIKNIFNSLEKSGRVVLQNGFPTKGKITVPTEKFISAKEAFEILASEPGAKDSINKIHEICKAYNIWIWKNGAIETPLGLTGKKEADWAKFKTTIENDNIKNTCAVYDEIEALVNWLKE